MGLKVQKIACKLVVARTNKQKMMKRGENGLGYHTYTSLIRTWISVLMALYDGNSMSV